MNILLDNQKDKKKQKVFAMCNGKFEPIDVDELASYKQINTEDWWLAKDNATSHKYDIAIQCIARQEEKYFKEWIEHHLNLGFERIFIYDNNDITQMGCLKAHLSNVLSKQHFAMVEIIPWHERMMFQQLRALEDCIAKHGHDIKWLLSLDLDEFFVVDKSLKEFLKEFDYASQVYFSWENIGADGQLHYEDKPVMQRFFKEFKCPDKCQGKIIFRPQRLKNFKIHAAELFAGKTVNVLHQEIQVPDSFANVHKFAWVKHYFTKSLQEWEEKMHRGCADHLWGRRYKMFFECNPDLEAHYDPNDTSMITIQAHANAPIEKAV